jgi:Kazal-type serine protease inhibitor domain
MRRMRARWVLGAPFALCALGALALSCGSGGADGLFTQPSSNGGGGAASAGASNHAGAPHVNGGAGGANNTSGGVGASSEGGAAHGGATGQAGATGGSTSNGGGGTGGSHAGGGGSHAGGGGSHAGSGGSHAGGGGAPNGGAPNGGAPNGGAPNGGAPNGGAPNGGAPNGGAAGGATAGAGGSMAGAGGSAGATCVDNGACMNDEYCAKPSCAAKAEGHCTPSPSDCGNTKLAVVCGCDGVTYHDACLLHQARQNSSALDNGACSKALDSTVTCTEADAQKCAGLGGVCGFKAENACIAVGPGNTGICWVLPASCPGSDDKTAQTCLAESTSCSSQCDAIKNGQRYAVPDHCN